MLEEHSQMALEIQTCQSLADIRAKECDSMRNELFELRKLVDSKQIDVRS